MPQPAALFDREPTERELVDSAANMLTDMLGAGWAVRQQPAPDRSVDALWTVSGPNQSRRLVIVEAKANLTPAMASRDLVHQLERSRKLIGQDAPAVVVSSWLSPRTRKVLEAEGISYLDMTGNVWLRISDPAVFVRTEGDQHDPRPRATVRRGITGPRAGRVVRQLVDFRPPRRAAELADASGISESYLSRVLDVLNEEALIRRKDRVIVTIDWPNLLRTRAASYQLMKANHVVNAVARRGIEAVLEAIRSKNTSHPVYLTGTMVANSYAPLAVGGALMLYVPPGPHVVDDVMKDLMLLRTQDNTAAAVQLLQPMSDGALERPYTPIDGLPTVGLSQLALDCLAGPGRMPAAGEALISWMQDHEGNWRGPSPLSETTLNP